MKSKTTRTSSELFVAVTHTFIDSQEFDDMTPSTMKVYLYLLRMRYKGVGICFPSMKTICTKMQFGERTVQRAFKELEEAGLLDITPHYRADGSRTTNQYTPYMLHLSDEKIDYIEDQDDEFVTPPPVKSAVGALPTNQHPLEEYNTIPEEDTSKDVIVDSCMKSNYTDTLSISQKPAVKKRPAQREIKQQELFEDKPLTRSEQITAQHRKDYDLIYEIAGMERNVSYPKAEIAEMLKHIRAKRTPEQIGETWKAIRALEPDYWNSFISFLTRYPQAIAKINKKKPTFDERKLTPEQIEEERHNRLQSYFDKALGRS